MPVKSVQSLAILLGMLVIVLSCENENNQLEVKMEVNADTLISAQIVFNSASGKIVDGTTVITADNIMEYQPNSKVVSKVSDYLKKKGFDVGPMVGTSCSLTGTKNQFEQYFNVMIIGNKKEGIMVQHENEPVTYEIPAKRLPENLANEVRAVTFSPPPDFGPSKY